MTNRLSRPHIRLSAVLASAVAVGLTVLVAAAPANASTPSSENIAAEKAVLAKVFNASDQEAAYTALSTSDKALVAQALTHQQATTVISVTKTISTAAAVPDTVAPDAVVPAASGCWTHYQYDQWSDLGFTEGYTWEQLNWCGNGSTVTSYSRPGNLTGGQGQNGVAYVKILLDRLNLNVGWEVRSAVEFEFKVLNTGVLLQPCMQIRGGASGLYSALRTCNLN